MSYEEALARIMLVMDAGRWGRSHESIALSARVSRDASIVGKLRALRSRGWVRYRPTNRAWGGYWSLTPEGARVQAMLRVVRDRTVESPAWP